MPHGLIACYEMGRTAVFGMADVPLAAAAESGRLLRIGRQPHASLPGDRRRRQRPKFPDDEVAAECARVEGELGLPACDVIRHGPAKPGRGGGRVAAGVGGEGLKKGRVRRTRTPLSRLRERGRG